MSEISIQDARRLFLMCQGLARPQHFGRGKNAVLRAIEQLGYIQIDTISVVERAHHHVLRTRVPNYGSAMLDRLQTRDRKIFEYWSHAAAFLPMSDFRFYRPMMEGYRHREVPHPKLAKEILARVRTEGPLQSRDFEDPQDGRANGWWDWKPAKMTLESLFLRGELMVTRRDGFQKVFDLTERVIPAEVDTRTPSREAWCRFIALGMVRALGLATAMDVGYARTTIRRFTGTPIQGEIELALTQLVEQGMLVRFGEGKQSLYSTPDLLAQLPLRLGPKRITILSPFDNLVINRARTQRLFGFDYQLECYVPAPKRQFGYFCLPILWGEELIGRMDAKAVRDKSLLEVRLLHLEPGVRADDRLCQALGHAVSEFARDNGCAEARLLRTDPTPLAQRITCR